MTSYRSQKQHAPIDENVQLPAAIRAASARSDALHKAQYKTEDAAKPDDGTKPEGNNGEAKEPKVPEAPKAVEKAPKPETPEPNSAEDWENRYKAMKGRNDRNESLLTEQGRELLSLREDVNRMKAAPAQVQQPTADLTFKKITDEDRTNFGEDFIDVAKRAAAEAFMPEIERLKQQVTELGGTVNSVARTTHENATLTMNERLDAALPNWKEINRNPKFLAWVGLRDPYSGGIRIDMMRAAHQSGDAQRVLAFFKGFLSDEAIVAPQDNSKDTLLAPKTEKVSLESLAAPGRAKASASDAPKTDPDDKEIITRAQVQEFYKLKNSGHYRGRDAEANALEERIFAAQRDGRIR